MTPEDFRATWCTLTREERRFVRAVAALGETAGSASGNSLVAAYAAERLRRLHLAAQALVTLSWVGYLVTVFTVLRETPTGVLTALALACAGLQATWFFWAEQRLQRVIAVNG